MLFLSLVQSLIHTSKTCYSRNWISFCVSGPIVAVTASSQSLRQHTSGSSNAAATTAFAKLTTHAAGEVEDLNEILSTKPMLQATPQTPAEELAKYLTELQISWDDSPLCYWRESAPSYPHVSTAARDYLAIPGTKHGMLFCSNQVIVTDTAPPRLVRLHRAQA
jgi:hypothetical protein